MAFVIEHEVKFKIDYRNCYGSPAKGLIKFDFEKNNMRFFSNVDSSGDKATLSIEDMREVIRIFDEEKAKLPVQVKLPKKKKVVVAKKVVATKRS